MSSITINVYATSKANVQYYTVTFKPNYGPPVTALSRYSELRAFRKTISAKRGFPPKLYFPSTDDLEKRRQQISKWLTSILPTHGRELETFLKSQRTKYEEDEEEEEEFNPVRELPLYISSSDNVRKYDSVNKNWPIVLTFHLFHVHLDIDSHLYPTSNCLWAPSFRGIQFYYPSWHKTITIPYPPNFLKSIAPQHGVSLGQKLVLYHHRQLAALDISAGAWGPPLPPIPSASASSSAPPTDNLWWPGFLATGKNNLHLIYPTEHFVFNMGTKTWRTAAPPPVTGTYYPGWVYAHKKIYMIVCSAHTPMDSYAYDVRLDEWTAIAPFPSIHKVPTVVTSAYDGNSSIYARASNQIFLYHIGNDEWAERREMALADRSMALFFSNQFEEGSGGKEAAIFRSKIEKLLVRSKLSGAGPWGELYQKTQITQAERDLMVAYESASISERVSIFKQMGSSYNVFQQLWEDDPDPEAKERIEWLIFQALQEEPSLGETLCNVCPIFRKTESGTYTWNPPGSWRDDESALPKKGRRKTRKPSVDAEDDEGEEGEAVEASEEGEKGERIMRQLREKKVNIPEEFICPLTHVIMLDPTATEDGHAFERAAIEQWFLRGNDRSPVTQEKLTDIHVIPNLPLRKLIRTFLETHGIEV